MQHAVEHELEVAMARRAAEKAYENYSVEYAQYKPTADWTSDTHCDVTFTVKGVTLEGAMELVPGKVLMDLDVPLLFRPFKKLALGYVEKEIRIWLDKAARGELDDEVAADAASAGAAPADAAPTDEAPTDAVELEEPAES